MLNDKDKVILTNRFNGTLTYMVPDLNIKRTFIANETKKVATVEEIRLLDGSEGGHELLADYLMIQEPKELIYELFPSLEPEYNYTEKDVIRIIQEGTLDEFKDCMDFAPEGVIEMIKSFAVSLPMNDASKRAYILEKIGFDVTRAIENQKFAEGENAVVADKPKRRAATSATQQTIVIK